MVVASAPGAGLRHLRDTTVSQVQEVAINNYLGLYRHRIPTVAVSTGRV
jgi:hypothetical protein